MISLELITKNDLLQFKSELMEEIKKLITPQQQNAPIVYKSKEVKKILKCSDSTLQYLRQSGKLQAEKRGGTYYYSSDSINHFLTTKEGGIA